MKLREETIDRIFKEFSAMMGLPKHLGTHKAIHNYQEILYEQLSKYFTEETIWAGVEHAFKNTNRFPQVADFFDPLTKYKKLSVDVCITPSRKGMVTVHFLERRNNKLPVSQLFSSSYAVQKVSCGKWKNNGRYSSYLKTNA